MPTTLADPGARDLIHSGAQIETRIFDGPVVLHTARLFEQPAGPPRVERGVACEVVHRMPL